jgi:hypothetical protein
MFGYLVLARLCASVSRTRPRLHLHGLYQASASGERRAVWPDG